MSRPLIVITGPTATGKTALGVALGKALDGEVVSADSMQLYRYMDIGTAKPTPEECGGVPHHMLDVADPSESYSVSRYVQDAARCVDDILARGKQPLLVGGTGLYIDSLLAGTDFAAAPEDPALREALSGEYDAIGGEAFREMLRQVDPLRAEKLAPGDKKRLVRALEVYRLTGETITAHDERTRALPPRYPYLRFALTYNDRETLYERIDRRVDEMLERGLLREVEELLRRGLTEKHTAMQAIGYKEPAEALLGKCTPEEAVEAVKQSSRRYAKRQLTWLRREKDVIWLPREDYPTTEALCEKVLQTLRLSSTDSANRSL